MVGVMDWIGLLMKIKDRINGNVSCLFCDIGNRGGKLYLKRGCLLGLFLDKGL